jgi:drug/metabolite transporter (DMT)-like permease
MWVIFAFVSSILWGLAYVINEQIYRKISVVTSIGITTLFTAVVMLLIACKGRFLMEDLGAIRRSNQLLGLVVAETIVLMLAEVFIGLSITNKNATLAGLIEISYPVFIILFAYLLFKENQLSISAAAGGSLIFLGIFIIYYFNK